MGPVIAPDPSPEHPWAVEARVVAEALGVDPTRGLSSHDARRRLIEHGANQLRETARRSIASLLISQLKSVIVVLLAIAAGLSFVFDRDFEGVAVLAVIVVNALVGFVTEFRAVRSMEALRTIGNVETTVRRDGALLRIPARELVPGDILVIEGGDVITADARLLSASRVLVDESSLTGESVPVDKREHLVAKDASLFDRTNLLHKGTSLTRGAAEAVIFGTGMKTELGRITSLVEETEEEETPLERRLARLGRQLMFVSLGFAAFVAIAGVVAGRDPLVVVETAIALAVATVPEGLPIVATMALARGMWRMAKRQALIERLSAVETLGSTSVILTDKTGTLTENRMRVVAFALEEGVVQAAEARLADQPALTAAVEVAVLCTDASLGPDGASQVGDPMEIALLQFAADAGISHATTLSAHAELREEAFDPELKLMATMHRDREGILVAVKGAPEAVLDAATHVASRSGVARLDDAGRDRWLKRSTALAQDGLRVLALAHRRAESVDENPYRDLTLLALVALLDPPRAKVRDAIEACRSAGLRIVMATGDQAPTALHVARAVHLVDDDTGSAGLVHASELGRIDALEPTERARLVKAAVVARTSPAQKLDLIELHQDTGAVVAMLGDGVNDAPALRRANIGVAMGRRGTQVAREAADMVLLDDELDTVVAAVEEGRVIFRNIRQFVVYLLSCNLSEILVIGLASIVSAPLPLLPLQILFLNLVTDVFPALALGVGEGDSSILERPPRPRSEPVLTRAHWLSIGGGGASITAAVLGAFAIALSVLDLSEAEAVTVAFLTLGFAQLWHVFDMPAAKASPLRNAVTTNPHVWGAVALCIGLLVAAVYVPIVAEVLGAHPPGSSGWSLVAGASLIPVLITWSWRLLRRAAGNRAESGKIPR